MKKTILLNLVVLLVTSGFVSAEIRPVPSSAYPTIQAAIDAASNGDTVIVATGTYTGTGNRDINFKGKKITVCSTDPNDPNIVAATIIDCNTLEEWGEPSRGFTFNHHEDANSVLSGFTITNGREFQGGGIFCWESSPTIKNCVIKNNNAPDGGGGIYCYLANPKIINCVIKNNHAWVGGCGICCWNSSPTITNCTITNNTLLEGWSEGGGIYCCSDWHSFGLTITNCTITNNTAGYGAGIYSDGDKIRIANCKITGNIATECGGGIFSRPLVGPSEVKITNSVINGNSAESGAGVYINEGRTNITNSTISANYATGEGGGITSNSDTLVTNCILWGHRDSSGTSEYAQLSGPTAPLQVTSSCIQDDDPNDDYIPFGGADAQNIDDNPLFVRNPNDGGDGWGIGDNDDYGDLHLRINSPCINAGTANFICTPETKDIDGQPRIIGCRVDMGADEFEPMIVVTRPQASDTWAGSSRQEITWSSYGVGNVNILLSKDSGSRWQTIAGNIPNSGSYTWQVPNTVDSNQCLISVVPSVPDINAVSIDSGAFTILSYRPRPSEPGGPPPHKKIGPQLGCVKWQFQTAGPVTAGATIGYNNRVHVACEDGKVYALNAGGALLWSYDTNTPLVASPAVGRDGTVYAAGTDGKLYAMDSKGRLLWTYATNGPLYSAPLLLRDGRIYLCSLDGMVYALNRNGSKLWGLQTTGITGLPGSILAWPGLAADGTIYIANMYDPNLYALNPNDGSIKWACSFVYPTGKPRSRARFGWPFAPPAIAQDGTIYQTLLYDTKLYAIEPNAGTILWSTDLADPCSGWFDPNYAGTCKYVGGWSGPALGPDGTIYASFDDPYLRAVDPNGTIKWVKRLGTVGGFTLTVGSDGIIYAASDDAHLYVVDSSGEKIAQFEGDYWLSFPVITEGHTVIVSDANNMVWAIGQDCNEEQTRDLHSPEDLDHNQIINLFDFALLATDWQAHTDQSGYHHGSKMYPKGDVDKNQSVDLADLAALGHRWLSGN